MKKPPLLFIAFFIINSCLSCEPDWEINERTIIVEGIIESDGHPIVILSRSIQASTHETSLEDCIIATAKVTVSDGDTCVVLSGGIDHDYFPPYTYTSSHIIGECGKTYTLDIYYNGTHISAVTSIPESCEILGLKSYSINDSTAYGIQASFQDNSDSHNYYQFFTKNRNKESRYYPSVWGFVDNRTINVLTTTVDSTSGNTTERTITHNVYPGRHVIEGDKYKMFFSRYDTVQVKLATMDSISSIFWQEFQNTQLTSELGFFSIINKIEGNVSGAKGYWCGLGTSKDITVIDNLP